MAEFTIGTRDFKSSQIDAFVQIKIVKRLAPLFPYFGDIADAFNATENISRDDKDAAKQALLTIAGPIIEALQKLPEADLDYIIAKCLAVTMIREANIWSPIMRNGQLQYPVEITAMTILVITVNVLLDNVASFSAALGESGIQLPGVTTLNGSK